MIEHQQIMKNIKANLLQLYIDLAGVSSSLADYISLIEQCLKKYLDINQSTILMRDGDHLKLIDSVQVVEHSFNTISYKQLEAYFNQQSVVQIPNFLAKQEKYACYDYMMQLKSSKQEEVYGIFLFKSSPSWLAFSHSSDLEEFVLFLSKMIQYTIKTTEATLNENLYRKLYNMTDLFHSTMNIDEILVNVLNTIEENFPDFEVDVILSNDQDRHTTIKIKAFDYLSERPATIEAFVSGEMTSEMADDLNVRLLNVPIRGRQAIYGILQISAPTMYVFSKKQKEFIQMLAITSGNALENAKLYHQSHRLVSDLQMINETSHRLNMKLNLHKMLQYLKKQLVKSFQPAELCFILKEEQENIIMDASTDFFKRVSSDFYIEHVGKHFEKTQDPLFIADFSRITQKETAFRSMMAIPMLVEEKITGFSIVLHQDSYFFSFDSFKLMQSLIQHSSLAIANFVLRNRLQDMVDRDHLTNLYARGYLDKHVEESLLLDDAGMFLLIDIDDFKCINDKYGHPAGDEILVQIANELKRIVNKRGISARWGGEELAVYMPNIYPSEAYDIAKEIVEAIPNITHPQVTISAGLITWDQSERLDFKQLFLRADTALYTAKNQGKNQVSIYNSMLEFQS